MLASRLCRRGRGAPSHRRPRLALLLALAAAFLLIPASAHAGEYTQTGAFCDFGSFGGIEGGECRNPWARIALDTATDHVFYADPGNSRVQVFEPNDTDADFKLRFGSPAPLGIAVDSSSGAVYTTHPATSEFQLIKLTGASGGTFTLSFEGSETDPPLAFNASPGQVDAALEALPSIGAGNVSVSAPGSPVASYYGVTFKGALAGADLDPIVVDGSALTPSGATATLDLAADGGPAGIAKYLPDDHADPTAYTPDPTFTSPEEGSGPGQVGSFGTYTQGSIATPTIAAIAVDPTTGDVILADNGNKLVQRFTSAGTFVEAWNGSSSGAAFTDIHDIAVDSSGRVIVADKPAAAPPRVLRFDGDGTNPVTIGPFGYSSGRVVLAARHDDDQVFVATTASGLFGRKIYRFESSGTPIPDQPSLPVSTSANFSGLAVDSERPFRLYAVTNSGNNTIRAFAELAIPIPTINPVAPGDITTPPGAFPEATFHGTVDPDGGNVTECRFEYVPASDPEGFESTAVRGAECDPAPETLDPDGGPQAVSATATGLIPDEPYQVRLFAAAFDLSATSATELFDSPAIPPLIASQRAWQIDQGSAILLATVNPANNEVTSCDFQYVTQAQFDKDGFASAATAPCLPTAPGSGLEPVQVSAQLTGLAADTAYRFRLTASNGVEVDPIGDPGNTTAAGPDQAFQTYPVVLFPARGYELVSAFDTNGYPVGFIEGASPDGNHFAYTTSLPAPGSENGQKSPFRASRNPDGTWTQAYMGPPAPPPDPTPGGVGTGTLFSADLSRAADVHEINLLDPDDQNKARDAYLKVAGVPGVSWLSRNRQIPLGTPQLPGDSCGQPDHISADGSRVLIQSSCELLLDAGTGGNLYEWDEGALSLISAKPGLATGFGERTYIGSSERQNENSLTQYSVTRNAVSPDGRRVAFQVGPVNTSGAETRLLVRLTELGATLEASAPAAGSPAFEAPQACFPGGPPDPCDVNYWGADAETTQLFFTSTSRLTPDSDAVEGIADGLTDFYSPSDSADLYRYTVPPDGDPAKGELVDLTPASTHPGEAGAGVFHVLRVSDDARRIYFLARGVLAPGAKPGTTCRREIHNTCNLYLASLDGPADTQAEITWIATTQVAYGDDTAERQRHLAASPDGRHLAFLSNDVLVPGRETGMASATGDTKAGSDVITNLDVSSGAFALGSRIIGPGIPDPVSEDPERTAIVSVDPATATLTLSRPATATATGVPLHSAGFAQAYIYDAERDSLACVSCPADGSGPASAAPLAPAGNLGNVVKGEPNSGFALPTLQKTSIPGPRNLTADSLFFATKTPLLPGDSNGKGDVYEYRGGALDLISSGAAPAEVMFADTSADGRAVFFRVRDSLVPGVGADIRRVYAAVVGGGAPPLPLPDPPCTGEDCKPVATAQPNYAAPSTSTVNGRGNVVEGRSCAGPARQAQRLSRRAKRLRRAAARSSNARRAALMRRNARRFAKAAKKRSNAAQRCRRANRRPSR